MVSNLERHSASLVDDNRRAAQQIAALQQRADAAERLATEARQARTAEAALAELRVELAARDTDLMLAQQWREGIERSPFYRLLRAYTALYRLPVVGPALGTMRRGAARVLHSSRRG